MIVAGWLLTFVLPQGAFDRTTDDDGHDFVVAGSYRVLEDPVTLGPQHVLLAIPRGFEAAADIIFFVFIIGGAFGVLRVTGAADALLAVLLARLGHRPALLIAGGMLIFAVGSSTIGMAEEYIPFVPILIALAIGLGFDAVTGVGILCIGYAIGYGVAAANPFTVIIAQSISGLPPTSGWWLRVVLTLPFLAVGFHHVYRYAARVRRDPSTSLVADVEPAPSWTSGPSPELRSSHLFIWVSIALALVLIVVGIKLWGFYLVEMGAIFAGLTVVFAILGRLTPDRTAAAFCEGAAELTTTALLIGFARAIKVVLDDGQIVDTIVHGISMPLQHLGPTVAAVAMFFVQSACNLFIPSGSGQAYVTMPIIAPLSDLVGVHRQVAVLAYQFGDGFTNILVPTNAVLIGILAMARIPYDRWLRFVLPFMVKMWILGSAVLALAVWLGYS